MNKLIILFSVLTIFLISGCNDKKDAAGDSENEISNENKKEVNKEPVETKEELKSEADANPDISEEDKNKLNELGMTPGLPVNFPADIPQPNNSKALGSLNTSEGTVVTFESNDKVIDIVNYYKEKMKEGGYTISDEGETLVSEKGGLINWTKEDKIVGLMLGYDKDKNITSLVITYK